MSSILTSLEKEARSAVEPGGATGVQGGVLLRYRERYEGFGPVPAMEKLAEEGYELGRETLRTWLIE